MDGRLPGHVARHCAGLLADVATEPLPAAFWDEIGLRPGETFNDHRHLIIYGQRTDRRPLRVRRPWGALPLGSKIKPEFDRDPAVFAVLRRVLVELFPAVAPHAVTHTWGGPLGIPRDWFPSVGLDPATGIGWAGGYVGDGVGIEQPRRTHARRPPAR